MEDRNLIKEMVEKMDDAERIIFAFFTLAILEPDFAEKLKEKAENLK